MPNIIVPAGGSRDGWIWISVNGQQQWVKAGVETEVDDSEAEVLEHAGIAFTQSSADLPEGATGYIDFANGAFFFVDESYQLNEVIGAGTYYEPGVDVNDIDASTGWEPSTTALSAFIGDAFTALAAGATIVMDVELTGDTTNYSTVEIGVIDHNTFEPHAIVNISTSVGSSGISPDGTSTFTEFVEIGALAGVEAGRHKVAVTLMPNKIAASLDGGAVIEDLTTWTNAITDAGFGLWPQPGSYIRSIVFYPVQDNAALVTLSALD
jgi:hypothetical protein